MPNITQRYRLFGTPEYTLKYPDYSSIQGPPYYQPNTSITEAQLTQYIQALHDTIVTILIGSTDDIPVKLRVEVKKILFPLTPPPPLSVGNPILDVVANPSRPSGDGDVWRYTSGFAIHPLSNQYDPTGTNYVTVAHRETNIPNDPSQWVYANVVAYKF